MKTLDWIPKGHGVLNAASTANSGQIYAVSYDGEWQARFRGKELARGSPPECLEACAKSEAWVFLTIHAAAR